jgi:hypothetical protein
LLAEYFEPATMKYRDGTEVHEGDRITVRHARSIDAGVVRKLLVGGTPEATDWSLPAGGVVIEGGGLGLFVTDDLEGAEDIDFVSRAAGPDGGGDGG